MRKSSHRDVATARWHGGAHTTLQRASQHALDGGSWTFRSLRAVVALIASLAVLAAGATRPRRQARWRRGGGGPSYQSCDALDPSATTTLAEVRQAIGADHALNTHGLSGGGIGVAVIDTGVNQVDGLTGWAARTWPTPTRRRSAPTATATCRCGVRAPARPPRSSQVQPRC